MKNETIKLTVIVNKTRRQIIAVGFPKAQESTDGEKTPKMRIVPGDSEQSLIEMSTPRSYQDLPTGELFAKLELIEGMFG